MKTLQEYLNSKGKVEDGVVDIHGDRVDPMKPPHCEPKENGGKPYASDGKNIKVAKGKGLGDQGSFGKTLVYEPDVENNGMKKGSKDILTVPESIGQLELIPLISESLEKNPFLAESIVRDLKRRGILGILVGELMDHRETYKHLAELMGHEQYGEQICAKLVRAMKEEVSAPFTAKQADEQLDDDDDLENAGHDDVSIDGDDMDLNLDDDDDVPADDADLDLGGDPQAAAAPAQPQPPQQQSPAIQNFQRAMMSRF